MSPCQPIAPLGRPSEGGLTGSPDAGRCSAKAAPSPPSRRRRRRWFQRPAVRPVPPVRLGPRDGAALPFQPPEARGRRRRQSRPLPVGRLGQGPEGDMHVRQAARRSAILHCAVLGRHQAGCPSGQRERSVKPSASPTLVRIQDLPPVKAAAQGTSMPLTTQHSLPGNCIRIALGRTG